MKWNKSYPTNRQKLVFEYFSSQIVNHGAFFRYRESGTTGFEGIKIAK